MDGEVTLGESFVHDSGGAKAENPSNSAMVGVLPGLVVGVVASIIDGTAGASVSEGIIVDEAVSDEGFSFTDDGDCETLEAGVCDDGGDDDDDDVLLGGMRRKGNCRKAASRSFSASPSGNPMFLLLRPPPPSASSSSAEGTM